MHNTRITTAILATLLVLEIALVFFLRALGWFGTGNVIRVLACVVVTALPLLIVLALLAMNRFRFGVRSLLGTIALVAVFLYVSVLPILDYRSERRATMQLISENATINASDLDKFYAGIGLDSPPIARSARSTNVPPWLTPFIEQVSTIPPDESVRMIGVNADEQIQILANNWQRFPALQSIHITSGVTDDGLELLLTTIQQFDKLDSIHTNGVVPPKNWYGSLTNVRTVFVWGEGPARGTPFPKEHVVEIASIPNLEVFMELGYAFTDADARLLAKSPFIKRVILRKTAVTPIGESILSDEALNRVVYRN